MGAGVIESLVEVLPTWSERWRYPKLAGRVDGGGPVAAADLVDDLLAGLAEPVAGIEDAIHLLVAVGELRAAARLCEDPSVIAPITAAQRQALLAEIDDGEQAASAELDRRINALLMRAERASASAPEPEGLREALDGPDRETLLELWTEEIRTGEQRRTKEIRAGYRGREPEAPAWVEAIENCIAAGELLAAWAVMEAGPRNYEAGGPVAVARHERRWPFGHVRLAEILNWYGDPSFAQPGFNARWRPPASDVAGTHLVGAIGALREAVDDSSAGAFVRIFHELFEVHGVAHDIQALDGGFRAVLSCVGDPRLPETLLPSRIVLWLGPAAGAGADWAPPAGGPAVWLRLEPRSDPRPAGVAVLSPQTLFELIAPESGQPCSAADRRIHLLRELYSQFDLDDLIGSETPIKVAQPGALRTGVSWLFDLLGVRVDSAVLDTLLYDSSRNPLLLRGAMDYLVGPVEGRPDRVTTSDLARWRSDPSAARRTCDRLRAELHPAGQAVFAAAVLAGLDDAGPLFTAEALAGRLRTIFAPAVGDRPARPIADFLDISSALRQLAEAGLVTGDGDTFQLRSAGMLSHFALGADWVLVAQQSLSVLADRLEAVLESVQLELSREAVLHWIKNDLEALNVQLDVIGEHVDRLDPDLRDIWRLLVETLDRLSGAQQSVNDGIRDRLRAERLDMRGLLEELVTMENRYQRYAELTLEVTDPGAYPVDASHFLLDQAIRNIVTNAMQQFQQNLGPGRILVRLRRVIQDPAGAGRSWAIVDVHDSGSGLSAEQRVKFDNGEVFSQRPNGEGKGLRFARAHIDYCGGTLTLGPVSAMLGGAHFQIRLPLAD
jgi:signal transduction histidine kinase